MSHAQQATDEMDYLSQENFDREMERIYCDSWSFAGFLSDIPHHNDYFLEHIGGKEVIIQNLNGSIRAFSNVCPHRFSAIHAAPSGNRSLVCPYHLWSFDQEGMARVPAMADASCLKVVDQSKLRLERWTVQTVGNLIYVCLNPDVQPLENFLGPAWKWIEEISNARGHEFEPFEAEIKANWKIIINNTVEFYHAYSVHPQTFRPLIEAPLEPIVRLPSASPHIHYAMPLKEDMGASRRLDRMLKRVLNIPGQIKADCYEHVYSFPNLTIGHVNGRCFSFFRYTPVSPTRTRLKVRMWMPPAHEASETVNELCVQYEASTRPFIKTISDEDQSICEMVQRGVASRPKGAMQNFIDNESLVGRFQSDYHSVMKGESGLSDQK